MAHEKYTTDCIVLYRREVGEADVLVTLLTEDLGVLTARAQNARAESAKMRAFVQSLAQVSVTLVRGRHQWRLVGVEAVGGDHASPVPLGGAGLGALARIARFVRRMTLEDALHHDIYSIVTEARDALCTTSHRAHSEDIELVAVAKLLIVLGYLPADTHLDPMHNHALVRAVNNAIAASQL